MRITAIPQMYRNLRRWQEIIVVLRRYGLADWLSNLRVDFIRDWLKDSDGVPLSRYSRETRIRMALTDLGPTFIKLGQVLSLRPDLIGSDLAKELQHLQTNVAADPPAAVRLLIESELEDSIDNLFLEFCDTPIASASIGQVHLAKLKDGTEVVVKVQHPDIDKTIHEDLEVMSGLATLAERIPELAAWRPSVLVEQLSRSLKRELNFNRELQQLNFFSQKLSDFKLIRVPKPFYKLSTARVLTMEFVPGKSLSRSSHDAEMRDETRQTLARQAAELYVEMVFSMGVYHADPHPGNIVITPDYRIGLLDFGNVGRLDDRLRETIEDMLMAVASGDVYMVTNLIKRAGNAPPKLDESSLSIDVADLISTFGSQPLESFDLAGALNAMTDILYRHQITLPPQTALLIKMLVTLQGTLNELAPTFSLLEVIQPFFKRMWIRRWSPMRQARRMRRIYIELENLVETLPSQLSSVMQLVQDGKLDVHLAHRGLSPSVNRLVLGMLVSALFMGSTLLLAYEVPPLLFTQPTIMGIERLSLFGLFGYVSSILIGLRLIRAINKSGHLDHTDTDF